MRHKYKLSFSIFIISSCFVQVANAGENRNGELKRLESLGNGRTVPTGSALVTNTVPISSNITVSEGGVEIVDNRGTSMGATIQKGGMQIVTRGATAMKTKIHGSKQFILEDKSITNLEDVEKRSSAYDATVSGGNGAVGQQNLYDGGMAWNTKVMQGGEQNLYMGQREDGGIAEGTIISGDGRQHILAGGRASNTTLNDKSVQVAYPDGIVDGLTISGHASSWLHVGVEVTGEIKINDKGHLYLFAGDRTDHITRGRVSVEGRNDEVLFLVGERHNMEKLQIDMESLSGSGGTVVFSSIPYDPGNISLYVQKLSGSLNFHFNISSTGSHSDYLWIESGAGNHKISVTDSGVEITGPLLQKNGIIEINLITDRSGGANFTLTDRFGEKIESVDGGTFIYGLYKRERSAEFSGDSTTWYLGRATGKLKFSNVNFQRVNKKPKTPVILATSSPDISTVNQSHRNFSSSQRQDSNSQTTRRKNNEQTSKPRPPRHLRDAQRSPAPPTVPFLENLSADTSYPADGYHNSDEKEPSVISADGQFLIDQMIVRPGQQGSSSPQFSQKLPVADFLTTPSTDAVLSMSVTPALVFHNELQAVRAGRGVLDRGKKNTAFWVHAIKSKEHIIADHKDFKLDQTGIILGISGISELMNGKFYIGGFGSYDQARVTHARGGVSGINTYSIGAYATYFNHNGWYLDGVLKYNQYQNNLQAVSTNGIVIEGNYNQWGLGTSFEVGYRFETTKSSWMQPYAQLSWLQVEGKEIKLSNEMTGDINAFTSLRSEVGMSAGYEFCLGGDVSSMAYITAAWLRENRDSNHTTINKLHQFVTDLSGNFGKLGIGLSSLVSEKFKFYAEAQYVKGDKVKQSFQGILGVRYSF